MKINFVPFTFPKGALNIYKSTGCCIGGCAVSTGQYCSARCGPTGPYSMFPISDSVTPT